jgi:hypothetical protein
MGLFSKKKKADGLNGRYKESPILILFESYVLDTIGHLPQDKKATMNDLGLNKIFNTETLDWKEIVKQVLNLSDTIDIAILDLWYKNREIAKRQNIDYEPTQYAMDFADNYLRDDSKIDIWEGGSLEIAKQKIEKIRSDNSNIP